MTQPPQSGTLGYVGYAPYGMQVGRVRVGVGGGVQARLTVPLRRTS